VEARQRELPGLREVGGELARRAKEQPLLAVGAALAAGYVLGGGLFSRSSRWLFRAGLGAMAVPGVRRRVLAAFDRARPAAAGAPF
jgi:hypothetical protein